MVLTNSTQPDATWSEATPRSYQRFRHFRQCLHSHVILVRIGLENRRWGTPSTFSNLARSAIFSWIDGTLTPLACPWPGQPTGATQMSPLGVMGCSVSPFDATVGDPCCEFRRENAVREAERRDAKPHSSFCYRAATRTGLTRPICPRLSNSLSCGFLWG